MARPRRQPPDAEREQRRTAQRRELEHALEALLSSDGWRRWLRTRATLHAYSANNCLLIASQAWAGGSPRLTSPASGRGCAWVGACARASGA